METDHPRDTTESRDSTESLDHPRYMYTDPQDARETRDRTPTELADQCLAELTGGVPSTVSLIDMGNQDHAKASQCLQEFVTERTAVLGQNPENAVDHKTERTTRDVISPPPRDVITTPRDVTKPPPRATNSRGFKTHVPGVFGKIQAKLDPSIKLVGDEIGEDVICKPAKLSQAFPDVETENSKPAPIIRSSSVLSSDDPVEIADQCLAELLNGVPNIPARDVICSSRDVITPPLDTVPPLHENIKQKPAVMSRRVSAPAMQRNARGFKTHVPGIFDKIQAKLDTSLIPNDMDEEFDIKPQKTSNNVRNTSAAARSENGSVKSGTLSRSSSVLSSSDDPVEMADQFLAEFEGPVPNISRINLDSPDHSNASQCLQDSDAFTLSRDVITPPRDVITPPEDVVPPLHENIKFIKPPVMQRRVSAPAMQRNARGFKTHVPGIFDKIQAKLDTSLVPDDVDDEIYSKPKTKSPSRFNKAGDVRPNKPSPISRSSSVLSSDDPIEIADQCLAELQNGSGVMTPPRDVITPPRDVITPPEDVVPPLHENIKFIKPPVMQRRVSAPAMQANSRGFKTHLPGIFGKIQAKLPAVKLVDEEADETNKQSKSPPPRDVFSRLNELEPDGFQNHCPGVFNKIQEKLYFNPEVRESGGSDNKQTPPSRDVTKTPRDVTPLDVWDTIPALHENIKFIKAPVTQQFTKPLHYLATD